MQDFGKIKEAFNHVLSEGITTKNDKKKRTFKKYINLLKENEILKTQFFVYNNIENKVECNDAIAIEFVKENIKLLNKFNRKDISEANSKLGKLIFEQKSNTNEKIGILHDNISTLIFTEKTPNTINDIIEATNNVVNYIKNNQEKVINEDTNILPISLITSIYVDKYNSKYENLDEDTVSLIRTVLESDENTRGELFSSLNRECLDLVNENLTESNLDDKEKLLAVKDKLLNMECTEENYVSNISSLIGLKGDLNE